MKEVNGQTMSLQTFHFPSLWHVNARPYAQKTKLSLCMKHLEQGVYEKYHMRDVPIQL